MGKSKPSNSFLHKQDSKIEITNTSYRWHREVVGLNKDTYWGASPGFANS